MACQISARTLCRQIVWLQAPRDTTFHSTRRVHFLLQLTIFKISAFSFSVHVILMERVLKRWWINATTFLEQIGTEAQRLKNPFKKVAMFVCYHDETFSVGFPTLWITLFQKHSSSHELTTTPNENLYLQSIRRNLFTREMYFGLQDCVDWD